MNPFSNQSQMKPLHLESEHAIETALYISDEFKLSDKLTIYGGLRYSYYAFLGPKLSPIITMTFPWILST